jgi:hypothetical protein
MALDEFFSRVRHLFLALCIFPFIGIFSVGFVSFVKRLGVLLCAFHVMSNVMFPTPCRCRHGTRARITLGQLGGMFSAFEYNDLADVGAERILGQINVWEIYVMNAELDFNSCVREHFIYFVRFNELVVFVYGKGDRSVRGFDEVEGVTERGVDRPVQSFITNGFSVGSRNLVSHSTE